MKSRFLSISIGITLMLFGAGFLIRSIQPANAEPTPQAFVDEGTNKIGKYMFQVFLDGEGRRNAVIMDTETGKSKYYDYGYHNGGYSFTEYEKAFPDNPFGE